MVSINEKAKKISGEELKERKKDIEKKTIIRKLAKEGKKFGGVREEAKIEEGLKDDHIKGKLI